MKQEKEIRIEHPELDRLLYEFYSGMNKINAEQVFSLLSPNLRQLAIQEDQKEKYQNVFLFDSNIKGALINKLTKRGPSYYDAVILLCREIDKDGIRELENPTGDPELDKLRFRIYCVKFIDINGYWYIDDIYQDNKAGLRSFYPKKNHH